MKFRRENGSPRTTLTIVQRRLKRKAPTRGWGADCVGADFVRGLLGCAQKKIRSQTPDHGVGSMRGKIFCAVLPAWLRPGPPACPPSDPDRRCRLCPSGIASSRRRRAITWLWRVQTGTPAAATVFQVRPDPVVSRAGQARPVRPHATPGRARARHKIAALPDSAQPAGPLRILCAFRLSRRTPSPPGATNMQQPRGGLCRTGFCFPWAGLP